MDGISLEKDRLSKEEQACRADIFYRTSEGFSHCLPLEPDLQRHPAGLSLRDVQKVMPLLQQHSGIDRVRFFDS